MNVDDVLNAYNDEIKTREDLGKYVKKELEKIYFDDSVSSEDRYVPHYLDWNDSNRKHLIDLVYPIEEYPNAYVKSNYIMNLCKKDLEKGMDEEKAIERFNELLKTDEDEKNFLKRRHYKEVVGNNIKEYYSNLKNIILSISNYWIYDFYYFLKCASENNSAEKIGISYGGDYICKKKLVEGTSILLLRKEKSRDATKTLIKHKVINETLKADEDEQVAFVKYAINKKEDKNVRSNSLLSIERASATELYMKDAYLEIQLELIYNTLFRSLFIEKNLSQEKSKAYSYEKIYDIYSNFDFDLEFDLEQIYLLERITGFNLSLSFWRYTKKIVEKETDKSKHLEIKKAMFNILIEFTKMPNMFLRGELIKEFLEPVLFWDTSIVEQLICVEKNIKEIGKALNRLWKNKKTIKEDIQMLNLLEHQFLQEDIERKLFEQECDKGIFVKHQVPKENAEREQFQEICRNVIWKSIYYITK